ncbi:unnamed protein product [Dicrocoelium dendriticum]|nr:unnamed protein product [Dicrocoelium dendriticum]
MEEFQTLADEIPDIVYEQVAPNLKKHPMIQGIYCFVRDSESERDHLNSERINYPEHSPREQSNIGLPVLGLSQASLCKIKSMVNECVSKLPVWLTVNVRNDPCLFSKVDDDWLPYAVREYQRIQQTISEQHLTGKELDNFEVGIRRGVLDILKALREQSFYFYDDITFFENQPVTRNASHADYLLVSEEVYSNVILNQPSLR